MRVCLLAVISGSLLALLQSGPGGCKSRIGQTQSASNPDVTTSWIDARPDGPQSGISHSDVESRFSSGADPLVPPIRLGDEPEPTGLVNAIDFSSHFGVSPDKTPTNVFSPEFRSDPRAHFHPHGKQVCASGCALSNHPTSKLDRAGFHSLLTRYAAEPMNEHGSALETLLFYGRQTREFLKRHGTRPLDKTRAEFLRRELTRTHALVSYRIVDEKGVVRCEMKQTRVPFDRRHVFQMDVKDLPPLVTSGTVKRVGLHHLWTRI